MAGSTPPTGIRAISSVWPEHSAFNRGAGGSNPSSPIGEKEMNLKDKMMLVKTKDDLMAQFRDVWGVGTHMSDQARRIEDGNINLETDLGAIRCLAQIVNIQLCLNDIEIKELEKLDR